MLRTAARALSLANLLWLPVWERVLYSRGWGVRSTEAGPASLLAVAVLGVVLAGLDSVTARRGGAWRVAWRLAVALGLLVPLNVLRRVVLPTAFGGSPWPLPLKAAMVAAAVAGLVWLAARRDGSFERVLEGVLLTCLPFTAVTVGQVLALTLPASNATLHPTPPSAAAPGDTLRRTVVLLFDELDYRLAFEGRSPGLRVGEFDRFAASSFRATQVRSTADRTLRAVPAMLTGRVVDEAVLDPRNRLWVRFRGDEDFQDLATAGTLFRYVGQRGGRVAVVGAWLPYCTLLPERWRCWQVPLLNDGGGGWDGPRPQDRTTVLEAVGRQVLHVVRGAPLVSLWAQEDPERWYRRLMSAAVEAVTDPEADLVWVHVPLPHPPWIFDRSQQRVAYSRGGYEDNLVLADRTLGELRRAMDEAGLWRESTVVVTSDHWYREQESDDRRVPLMVRFPGEEAWEYGVPEEITVVFHVVRAVAEGQVRSAPGLARWLDARRP